MKPFYDTADATARNQPRIVRTAGEYRYVRWRWRAMFRLIDAIGWSLVRVLMIARIWRGQSTANSIMPPRSILVVQLDHLGDAVLSTALLGELRQLYPHARIDVLAAPWNREIFNGCAEVTTVYVSALNRFSRTRRFGWPLAIAAWGWKLRRQRYDLGIDVRGEFPVTVLLWLAAVKSRLGWSGGGGGFLLTHRAGVAAARHEADSRRALLEAFDPRAGASAAGLPAWQPSTSARLSVRKRFSASAKSEHPLLVLHISAGTAAKRWPVRHWQELLGRIALEIGPARVILVGSTTDDSLAREILGQEAWPHVMNSVGQLSIGELAALIESADLFVGADSGPAHLAAATGTPAIVMFSGTNDPHVWQPRGVDVTVLHHPVACSPCHRETCVWADHPCLSGIAPGDVITRIRQHLSRRRESVFARPHHLEFQSR